MTTGKELPVGLGKREQHNPAALVTRQDSSAVGFDNRRKQPSANSDDRLDNSPAGTDNRYAHPPGRFRSRKQTA